MKLTKYLSSFVMLCCLLVLTACVSTQPINLAAIEEAQIKNLSAPSSDSLASGQPTKEQLRILAESGVKHIVNLRPESELDWDEGAFVESLGMQYHNIPVNGVEGITFKNARKLSQLLAGLKNKPVLVHCSSGNRVGALKALTVSQSDSLGDEAAVAEGKQWGLTRLEPTVREILAEQ